MGAYKAAVVTEAGQGMIAQALAGGETIVFTSAKTSDYSYPAGTNIAKLTGLQDVVQSTVPFLSQILNDVVVQVGVRFDNEDVAEPYLIQTLGLYARQGDDPEVLFAVIQAATPDQMPAKSTVSPTAFIYQIQVTVQQAAQISISVAPAGAASVEDIINLNKRVDELEAEGGRVLIGAAGTELENNDTLFVVEGEV